MGALFDGEVCWPTKNVDKLLIMGYDKKEWCFLSEMGIKFFGGGDTYAYCGSG